MNSAYLFVFLLKIIHIHTDTEASPCKQATEAVCVFKIMIKNDI